ncbi:MAG: 4Fe-4S dicluster domain-containing protein, partial [Clostridia bacterium]|nr:4Fe-4S dicluster domain-containing protein [Clostridia bacterium]
MELNELKTLLQKAGVVGAGGATFPTYVKLASGADTLIINAVECEPLLYTDLSLMELYMDKALSGIRTVMDAASISTALVGVKASKGKLLHWSHGQELAPGIKVSLLPDVYPMGDEINLIYQATGRVVPPGKLPITVGVIVMNLETVYNIHLACYENRPVTEKWLTINGNVKPMVVCVPIGVRVQDLFRRLGIRVPEDHVVIDGGPSMGQIIEPRTAIITKATKGLLILPRDIPAVMVKERPQRVQLTMASSACCGCSRCTDLCPRFLLGYPLEPHKHIRVTAISEHVNPADVLSASLCCGCGICEIAACCQYISPRAVIAEHKDILAKAKMRFTPPEGAQYKANPERADRMMSTQRWMQYLGVDRFTEHPECNPVKLDFDRVEIRL